jgi:glutamate---cysteine ligase / carboxylate-amine ligase
METNFGWSTPYSIGLEEEFQLIRADGYELVSRIEAILSAFEGEPVRPRIKPELHQSVVETSTKISGSVAEAVDDLIDLRARLRRAAAGEDTLIASAGTHPFSRYDHQEVTERPRYASLSQSLGWLADRQLIFGLHVHVGLGSAGKAIACADGLRRSLPELVALAANSPFWQGRDTGLASTRVKLSETLPRTGLPPALGSFAAFERFVELGVRNGCFPDYTHIWWDIRPHPRLGTIEIRICDGQTRIENTAALAALIQSLVATLGSAYECGEELPDSPDLLLGENRWRALRDGLDARLIDLDEGGERAAPDAIRALVERCTPAAEALGCAEELELVEEILARGNGADEQRRMHEETDSLREVARRLAEETAPRLAGAV